MNQRNDGSAEFLGLRFDLLSTPEAIRALDRLHYDDSFAYVVTPNVDHVVKLHRIPARKGELWEAYEKAALCLCDSRILQLLGRWSGVRLALAPGSDLTAVMLANPPDWLHRVAVVGADANVLSCLEAQLPHLSWLHHQPPMGVLDDPAAQAAIAEFVEQSNADVTFFAIGAPQSELICRRLAARQHANTVALCVGASLEFVTGRKRRSPEWMQQLKLEWLFRLLMEPGRLARRYLIDGPAIFRIWFDWSRESPPLRGGCDSSSSADR